VFRQALTIDAPMVARDAELQRVLSALDAVARGQGRCVFLVGEAGVGKTRLSREVITHASAAGFRVCVGRCFEEFNTEPFFPFSELFAAALAEAPPGPHEEAQSRWPELASVVTEFGAVRTTSGEATQLQVLRAGTEFLRARSQVGPLLLLLGDLHWADDTSLTLLLHLGRHIHSMRVLILGTCREPEAAVQPRLELVLRELRRERLAEEIQLRRLPRAGTAALMRTLLPEVSVSDELVTLVHERAQGNPFFTEELVAAFIDAGVVSRGESDLRTTELGKFRLPRSIRSAVAERVGRLPPTAQELLSVASVLGQDFPLDVLILLSGRTEAEILRDLDAALEAQLLEEGSREPGERYGFVHALIQEALYEALPAHRRRRLHLRAAEVLEELCEGRATPAELARHFLMGGDRPRAAAHAVQAGDDAGVRYAHAEAAHHYRIAVDILRDTGFPLDAAKVQCRLARELFDLNRLPEVAVMYGAALAVYEDVSDRAGQAVAHWGMGRMHQARYDMQATVHHLDAALSLWPPEREDAELIRLLHDATRANVFSANWDAASHLAERSLQLAERLADAASQARALLGYALAHDQDKDRPTIPLLDRAESLARVAGDWHLMCRIYGHRASREFSIGELAQALVDRQRAIEAADRAGEAHRLSFAYQSLAHDCLQIGRWVEGRAAARSGLDLDPDRLLRSGSATGDSDLAWMDGQYKAALSHRRSDLSRSRQRQDVQGITGALYAMADFELQLDRPANAEAPAREAAKLAVTQWRSEAGACLAMLSEVLIRIEAPDAAEVLRQADESINELEKDCDRPQLLRAQALLSLGCGDVSSAIATLEMSAALARSQGALVQLGRTLAVLVDAARLQRNEDLFGQIESERKSLADQIGREVCGLSWMRGIASARSPRHARSNAGTSAPPLSPRELEVAELVAHGLSDRQIAAQLVITEGTAGVHISHILNKLGVHTRAEIASWTVQHRLRRAL
jgi:DNA-binding CsgD family transcriptional regulator/tetratricopeptide (TPR) repeat protein